MSDVDAAPAPNLRKLRVRIGREIRWLWVEAGMARAINTFDCFVRRRNRLFRTRHVTGCSDEELSTRQLNKADRAVKIVGFVNAMLEPAADKLGLKTPEKPGQWEGPRFPIDRLLGESMTWTGSEFGRLERVPCGGPDAPRSTTQLVHRAERRGPCPVCHDEPLGGVLDGEVVVTVACLWCGRSNVDARIHRDAGGEATKAPASRGKR